MPVDTTNNLLSLLHRWASRQDENFVTESFAQLLRHLLRHEVAVGLKLVNWLTDGKTILDLRDAAATSVTTQVSIEGGRLDIEIQAAEILVYLELKVDAELGEDQLERYGLDLHGRHHRNKSLVLLSPRAMPIAGDFEVDVIQRRWHDLGSMLERESATLSHSRELSRFVIGQFVDFLKERDLMVERVSWEMPKGLASFKCLITMLRDALDAQGVLTRKTAGWDWMGFYVGEKDGHGEATDYFVGCYFDEPESLVFENSNVAVVPDAVRIAGCGEVTTDRSVPGGNNWYNALELDSEEVHFFALSQEKQRQVLQRFVQESLEALKRITKRG